ncbi:MAG: ABC transporter permease [Candidatus Bipolaricaulis sp.]|nr:ABC transporter permease [Candidatus Bipolaricaulis sp.]
MLRNVRLLFAKEMLGAVRDRRTLFLTVFFPLVFYPMVMSVMSRFTETERVRIEAMVPTVLVVDESGDRVFSERLAGATDFYIAASDDVETGLTALKDDGGQVLLAATKPSGGEGLGLSITLYYDQSNQMSVLAAGKVRQFLEGYLEHVVRDKLEALGMSYDELSPPLSVQAVDVATGESVGRLLLSRLLPYFMVLAILAGAMGLGAEITAGEKERSTIATLLVSQLSRTEIVLGKFLTVLSISLVSSFLSAIGLLVGIRYFGGGLTAGMSSGAVIHLDAASFGWMLVVLVPLAVILAALVIIIGSYARSQKEASTYLLPIYMVIVLVGMVSMTGGASFRGAEFLIPVANALYALQNIIVGDVALADLVYTLAANVACGGLLIVLAVRLFKREAVLFRS